MLLWSFLSVWFSCFCFCFCFCFCGVKSLLQCERNNTLLEEVLKELESQGYEIEQGWAYWKYNVSGYGANPMLGYGLFSFKRDSIVSSLSSLSLSSLGNDFFNPDLDGSDDNILNAHIRGHNDNTDYYMLYSSSAILWHDCSPPTEYISYRSYVNMRYHGINDTQFIADPYASLGDMLNQQVMNVSSSIYGNRTFDNLVTYVSTGDLITYQDIYNAFSNVGLRDTMNLDCIPYEYFYNGGVRNVYFKTSNWTEQLINGEPLDNFGIMYRGGMVATSYGYTHDDWVDFLSKNYTIYKITPPVHLRDNKKPRSMCEATVRNTTTGIREQDMYNGQLQNDFELYVNNVIDYIRINFKFEYRTTVISAPFYHGTLDYGFGCLEYDTRCLADNRDSQYFVTAPEKFFMPNSSYFIVIGVSHSAVGTNMWENIVPYFQESGIHLGEKHFYRADHLCYMGSVYQKSALNFPPNISNIITNENILDKFFVVSFMRDTLCEKFDDHIPHFCISETELSYNRKWFPFHRNYINPLTSTRPDWNEMIPFVFVEFDTLW